jgi:argininosuccinate lyase
MDHLTNLKGLPMGYNRDLQEDKPPLWDAFDIIQSCLGILPDILNTLDFQTSRMEALANANFATATELANYLVRECDLAFRECHEIVGGVVGDLVKMGKPFQDWEETQRLLQQREVNLSIPQLQAILDPKRALRNYQSLGSTSPDEVKRMAGEFEAKLNEIDTQIETRQAKIQAAHESTRRIVEQVLAGKSIAEVYRE